MIGLVTLIYLVMGLEGGALDSTPPFLVACATLLAGRDLWNFLKRKGVIDYGYTGKSL